MKKIKVSTALIVFCLIWGIIATSLVTVAVWENRIFRAVLLMADGLWLFWNLLAGALMWWQRNRIRRWVQSFSWDWRITFILFSTLLALLEEVVTTTMTNCAPLFGVEVGQAYITASTNYLDVVCFHSVVVIAPMFVGWALILTRYKIPPNHVMLLFGCTGVLAEMSMDLNAINNFGFWVLVYGLMIYLPAYCVPVDRPGRPLRWYLYPFCVVLPFLCVAPVGFFMEIFHLKHPPIHFPPIGSITP